MTSGINDENRTSSASKFSLHIDSKGNEEYFQKYFTTSGSNEIEESYFLFLPDKLNVFKNILPKIEAIESDSVKIQTKKFVSVFQKALFNQKTNIEKLGQLPFATLNLMDDKSVLVEWGHKDFRIGFSFEIDPSHSSWYLVSNKNLNEISVSDKISDKSLFDIVSFVLSFVSSYT